SPWSEIAEIKGKYDVLVALTHLSLAGDQQLAEQVPDIDLILGGHEHENWILERGLHFTPIIKADANAHSLAIVTVRVPVLPRRTGASAARAVPSLPRRTGASAARPAISARLQRVDPSVKEGPKTAAEVKKWVDLGFAAFRAQGFDPFDVVATIDEPLYARESAVRNGPTRLTEIIVDGMRHDAATQMAVFNSGSIRIDDTVPP